MDYREQIVKLIRDPQKLMSKKPFVRGASFGHEIYNGQDVEIGEWLDAVLPDYKMHVVSQETFMRELDPRCHSVLFDENIPSICIKLKDGNFADIRMERMAIPIQRIILNKQVMHLTANKMQFTLMDRNPSESLQDDFITFKQYWDLRNQDGMKTKMVATQLSYGDAGLLYYFDYKGRIKSRILSYKDGYVLCPHNDDNGDRILESVYYRDGDGNECIDSYDDRYMYRCTRKTETNDDNDSGWVFEKPKKHGFEEIPLVTKRGDVAWNNIQTIIESYEALYNVFNAIQKRLGWGLLYVKGNFKDEGRKIAGSVVINDTSIGGTGDAKFLTPPTPQGTIDTLNLMMETMQLGSSTTFLLPKDVKMSGDISGIAIMLTQSLDIENALDKVIEWQNVADKMTRLFKYGLAVELVNTGKKIDAVTSFEKLNINSKFKVWRPLNEYEYNQMLTILTGAGILSKESGIELNTVSKPDEKKRIRREDEDEINQLLRDMKKNKTNNNKEDGEDGV